MQKWDDDELTAALEWLREQLDSNIQLLSSFEKYKKEVLSGSLDWTPMHTSQQVRLEGYYRSLCSLGASLCHAHGRAMVGASPPVPSLRHASQA